MQVLSGNHSKRSAAVPQKFLSRIHVPGLLYFFFAQLLSHNVETHVVLGASNPNHASVMQMMQMGKVHVGFVENDDFSGANRLAKSPRHFRIGVLGPVHDGKIRQKGLQIRP